MSDTRRLPEIIRAVALDSNSMSHGNLDIETVEDIAEVIETYELQAEIWVPEPVIWEWSEHAASAIRGLDTAIRSTERTVRRAGLEIETERPGDDLATTESVLAKIVESLKSIDRVRIIWLSDFPQCAVAGVRDQSLQVGTGRRKGVGDGKSVKTGALDGTIFRLLESIGDKLHDVVLISSDRDARNYYKPSDFPPVIYSDWRALKSELVDLRPAEEVQAERFTATLHADLALAYSAGTSITIDGPSSLLQNPSLGSDNLDTTIELLAIDEVVDVSDVEFSTDNGFASATVKALVSARLTGVWWNDMDDQLEHDWDEVHRVAATLRIEGRVKNQAWDLNVYEGEIDSAPYD